MEAKEVEMLINQLAAKQLRFEHIVNELLEQQLLTKEQLVIAPERTSAHNFERSIKEIDEIYDDNGRMRWQVSIPRDGFYDTLPERLFHKAKNRTKDGDEWAEIREQEEKQESESRHFFLPFDNAFYHQQAKITQFEAAATAGEDKLLLTELLRLVAPETVAIGLQTHEQLNLFLLIIEAHRIAGNWTKTAYCFSDFLNVPVQVEYIYPKISSQNVYTADTTVSLEDCRLGLDWILTDPDQQSDEAGTVRILIGPLADEQIAFFLPDGIGQQRLQLLAGYLLPAEIDYRIDFMSEPLDVPAWLSDVPTAGRLGLTTVLP